MCISEPHTGKKKKRKTTKTVGTLWILSGKKQQLSASSGPGKECKGFFVQGSLFKSLTTPFRTEH